MKKDPIIFLKHVLESIDWIERDIQGLPKEEFMKNVPIQDAVVRRIEIIGEAIRNVPDEVKEKYPKVPWQDVMDMRNKLIHGYFGINMDLVWNVVKNDIPPLKKQVEEILKQS